MRLRFSEGSARAAQTAGLGWEQKPASMPFLGFPFLLRKNVCIYHSRPRGAPARLKTGLHLAGINTVTLRRAGVTFFP
jgi:hypothetical protein